MLTKAQTKLEIERLKAEIKKSGVNWLDDRHEEQQRKITELENTLDNKTTTLEKMPFNVSGQSKYQLSDMDAPEDWLSPPLFSTFAVPYEQANSLKSAASHYKRKNPEWDYATQIRTENNKSVCRIWRLK